MNERIKILIRWWKIKGQQENDDPFVKFFFFYVCFDAWITAESDGDRNGDKLNSFINGSSCLKESSEDFLRSPQAQSLLTDLKQLSPIKDMRPNRRGAHKELKDIHRLEEVVYFIYQ